MHKEKRAPDKGDTSIMTTAGEMLVLKLMTVESPLVRAQF